MGQLRDPRRYQSSSCVWVPPSRAIRITCHRLIFRAKLHLHRSLVRLLASPRNSRSMSTDTRATDGYTCRLRSERRHRPRVASHCQGIGHCDAACGSHRVGNATGDPCSYSGDGRRYRVLGRAHERRWLYHRPQPRCFLSTRAKDPRRHLWKLYQIGCVDLKARR